VGRRGIEGGLQLLGSPAYLIEAMVGPRQDRGQPAEADQAQAQPAMLPVGRKVGIQDLHVTRDA